MDKGQFLAGVNANRQELKLDRGTVVVRALSRPEAIEVSGHAGDLPAQERLTLLYGLVEPVLTAEEVDAYYGSPGNVDEVQAIVQAVQDLSLAGKGGSKSRVPSVRGGRGT